MYAVGVRALVHRAGRLRSERERRAREKANKAGYYVIPAAPVFICLAGAVQA